MNRANLDRLHGFLAHLRERYWAISPPPDDTGWEQIRPSLVLAEATLRDLCARLEPGATHPLHVVVVGPTQAGKSTVVNLLLGVDAARVSPLAGFTRYPQAFAQGGDERARSAVDAFLAGWRRIAPGANDELAGRSYGYIGVDGVLGICGDEACVVWDTPDFDSHGARRYRSSVLEIAPLADVLVLVVSKEKYSDLAVWQLMSLLRPLGLPLTVCLNKVGSEADRLVEPLRQRLLDAGYAPGSVAIHPLPYVQAQDPHALRTAAETGALIEGIRRALAPREAAARAKQAGRLIDQHWDAWLEPVHAELDAERAWRAMVDAEVAGAMRAYRETYLEHAQHYSTFGKAVARLLELLEIPVIAKPLAQIRRVLTWPLRRLTAGVAGRRQSIRRDVDAESLVLEECVDHLLLTLRRRALEQVHGNGQAARWWLALTRQLDTRSETLRSDFLDAIPDYQRAFEPEIERAAGSLYQRLKQSPATLNTLRAARVSADAAGVILAFKTGAIGANEMILTPAMLSLTSLLTESAVGRYVDTVRRELKTRQAAAVQTVLFDHRCLRPLLELGEAVADAALLGIRRSEVEAADTERKSLWP